MSLTQFQAAVAVPELRTLDPLSALLAKPYVPVFRPLRERPKPYARVKPPEPIKPPAWVAGPQPVYTPRRVKKLKPKRKYRRVTKTKTVVLRWYCSFFYRWEGQSGCTCNCQPRHDGCHKLEPWDNARGW